MAPPVRGLWRMRNVVVGPATNVWGTGINPIHMIYGEGPPERVSGRAGATSGLAPGVSSQGEAPVTQPAEGSEDYVQRPPDWGVDPGDIGGLDVFADPNIAVHGMPHYQDDWPAWTGGWQDGQSTPVNRARVDAREQPPLGTPGRETTGTFRFGSYDDDQKVSNEIPTETVSEGWTNKNRGMVADAEGQSDPAQYERQTSMQQRYAVRNNKLAVQRGTDDPRSEIESRTAGQKLKTFSGEQPGSNRHYDMFPFQADQMPRPFHYRTAGTGYRQWMQANTWWQIQAMRRTPPADPSMGIPETGTDSDYGYTEEDNFYA